MSVVAHSLLILAAWIIVGLVVAVVFGKIAKDD